MLMMHSLIRTQVPSMPGPRGISYDPLQISPQRLRFLVVGGRSFRPPNRTRAARFAGTHFLFSLPGVVMLPQVPAKEDTPFLLKFQLQQGF
jgi:hypothetical protein